MRLKLPSFSQIKRIPGNVISLTTLEVELIFSATSSAACFPNCIKVLSLFDLRSSGVVFFLNAKLRSSRL